MQRFGYLGPAGTFSQQAALTYTGYKSEQLIPFPSLRETLLAVQKDQIELAILPIENSLEGPVPITLDLLAWETELLIRAELILPISQNLLVSPGADWRRVTKVYTHSQSAGQCRKFLETNLPRAEVHMTYSNSEGANFAKAGGPECAAIGPLQAGEIFGLDPVWRDIQDGNNNYTRFVVVGKSEAPPTGDDKTSIVFSTEDKPGSLYRILDIFNIWDINMSRIESRPARDKLGAYIFFVDIDGHAKDPDVADALTMVKRKTTFYKDLGSYPRSNHT